MLSWPQCTLNAIKRMFSLVFLFCPLSQSHRIALAALFSLFLSNEFDRVFSSHSPQPQYYWFIAAIGWVYFYRCLCDAFVRVAFFSLGRFSSPRLLVASVFSRLDNLLQLLAIGVNGVSKGQWNQIRQFRGWNPQKFSVFVLPEGDIFV